MAQRRLIAYVVGAGIVAGGYIIMRLTVPKKEVLMERMADDLTNPSKLSKVEKRNQQLMKVIQKNIDSNDPVWKLKSLGDDEAR